MKLFAALFAAAFGQEMPADSGETNIIMINMNAANIQMNMGDFAGSEVPNLESPGISFDLFGELTEEEKAQVNSLFSNSEIQDGLQLLTGKLPGFSSFYDALYPAESTTTTTQQTTTTQESAGMGK
ncbi:Oidioi.mRNA.OKI2018_I69.PAR.g9635.t1.cds [Oikopleura dioica]|uniref:Oidioi.mRNA.OKI2018_I69.PAR.g9635.t1.cds n=1 Tax=Oikopleura dioica TaxID=34765 RepID=A0ABN7RMF3_OIKDI|nr:Oidioi.mRNA.OKI2018_I69.PAR.g9635.t1.cds [Oikopleura dioica]